MSVPAPVGPAVGPELRHGYNLDTLTRLARYAARHGRYDRDVDLPVRYEVAWAAIAEYLYAAEAAPAVGT